MAIHTLVYRAFLAAALLALILGCANPQANPEQAPPSLRDGDALDLTDTTISPSASGKPWIVSSDWHIPAGTTVTIQPGTEIMFSGLYWVDVEGKMVAEGQPDNFIKFTSAFLNRDLGQWRSFKLRNSNPADSSIFKYCVFEYGSHIETDTSSDAGREVLIYRGMLAIRNSSPVIENCLIYRCQNNAIFIRADSGLALPAPRIMFNVVTDNDGAAIRTSTGVDLSLLTIRYNSFGDNHIIPFLIVQPDSSYGKLVTQNANLDSTDIYYNLVDDHPPVLEDPLNGHYSLTSCSPAVDAGPVEGPFDPDNSRRDLGPAPYHQVGDELRGVRSGDLTAGTTYRMSCNVRVPKGQTMTIPAGVRIEATGLYNLEIFGQLIVQGTLASPVTICNCQVPGGEVWGGIRFFDHDSLDESPPSVIQYMNIENYLSVDVFRAGVQFEGVQFNGGLTNQYGVSVATHGLDPADSVSFRNCIFNNCGLYGIESDSSSVMIRNCTIQNIKGRGISLLNVGGAADITNTIARACSTSGIVIQNLSYPRIMNCVLADNGYHGLHLINNCTPPVLNTIIWANHHIGVKAEQSSLPLLAYNDVAGNQESDYSPISLGCANCLAQDPQFAGGADFHLSAGSPCIDAGNPDPQYNDQNGTRNDQGAFGGPEGGSVGPALRSPSYRMVQR